MNLLISLNMLEDVLARIEAEHAQESVWICGRDTARLLHFLVRVVEPLVVVEVGTSVGYSALFMAAALQRNGKGRLWTIESHKERFARAERNILEAELSDFVLQVKGHAPEVFSELALPGPIDFVFLDATKMEHQSYLDGLLPFLAPGAMVAVDNAASHRFGHMERFVEGLLKSPHFDVVEIPVGSGLLLARLLSPNSGQQNV